MPTPISNKPTASTHLSALKKDIDVALTKVKSGKIDAASTKDVKAWLENSLKSDSDAPRALKQWTPSKGNAGKLDKANLTKVLGELKNKIDSRMGELENVKGGDTKPVDKQELNQWATEALVSSAASNVRVSAKGGNTRPVSEAEVRSWLN